MYLYIYTFNSWFQIRLAQIFYLKLRKYIFEVFPIKFFYEDDFILFIFKGDLFFF